MLISELTSGETTLAVVLIVALVIIGVLIALATIVAGVLRIIIFFNYWATNRERSSRGYTGGTAATALLASCGAADVEVKQAGFFRALIFGNHYNPNKRTVFLRKSTFAASSLTAVGLGLQKAGIALMDRGQNDPSVKRRWRLQKFGLFGPLFFIPLVLVGVIVDFVTLAQSGGVFTGVGTLIASAFALALFVASFVLTIYTLKVEGKADRQTLETLGQTDFLSEEEQAKVAKVFRTYRLAYIMDFIVSLLEIIRLILRILLEMLAAKSKK